MKIFIAVCSEDFCKEMAVNRCASRIGVYRIEVRLGYMIEFGCVYLL